MRNPEDTTDLSRYVNLLYPDPPAEAWLVASSLLDEGLSSHWCHASDIQGLVSYLERQSTQYSTYIGIGLRHPSCLADRKKRGGSEDVCAIPGLWIEMDHSGGTHADKNLPTPEALLAFIARLPFRFSLLIDSSGGYHGYLLFKEPWLFEDADDRAAAAQLLRRFQRSVKILAAQEGWGIDTTSDLARVLRPPGTLNHKTTPPKTVTILHEDAIRYNPSDIQDAPWLATIDDTYVAPTRTRGDFPPSMIEPIVESCAWLRHCHDDAKTLSEPEWYTMLGIVGRCVNGPEIAQEWSEPHLGFSQRKFTEKLRHALDAAGPAKCQRIRFDVQGEEYCRDCPHWEKNTSPITLGEQRRQKPVIPMMHGVAEEQTLPEVAALIDSLRFPFVDTGPHIPPLPQRARQEMPSWCTWLDAYAEHSAYWAPRAAPAYHKAVGLWVLSTVAARRIVVQMGSTPVYPTLFLALVSPSTAWTKTTAAAIGVKLLRRAGCGHLLAPDRTTPQFLLKIMAGIVPQDYGNHDEEAQAAIRQAFGFTAQRGWFYEEWGGMLTQMKRVDSPHAELNKLLIVLEGGAESFETGTIQRGLERIDAPYLALLGNATPRDLVPFMAEGNAWWHDGFWPRFACVTPPYDTLPSRAPRPREAYQLPGSLIHPLHAWHTRLGSPTVDITEEREANGKLTGSWIAKRGPLPVTPMVLTPEVYDAYEAYNDALLEMVQRGDVSGDLAAWYGRAHEKALRVAMLLASLHGETTITQGYWAEGQAMAEHWRRNLHEIVATIGAQAPLSKEGQLEAKIESLLSKSGGMTARELQRHTHAAADFLHKTLTSMLKVESISAIKSGKKLIYILFRENESLSESPMAEDM